MTTIILLGDKKDHTFTDLIQNKLSRTYYVTYVKPPHLYQMGVGYELFVYETDTLVCHDVKDSILLLKEKYLPKLNSIPKNATVIANAENRDQIEALRSFSDISVFTCGTGEKDMLSYSSLTEDGAVITLNRQISALSGKTVQPLEIPIELPKDSTNVYPVIAYTALRLLLDDYDSDIGKLY